MRFLISRVLTIFLLAAPGAALAQGTSGPSTTTVAVYRPPPPRRDARAAATSALERPWETQSRGGTRTTHGGTSTLADGTKQRMWTTHDHVTGEITSGISVKKDGETQTHLTKTQPATGVTTRTSIVTAANGVRTKTITMSSADLRNKSAVETTHNPRTNVTKRGFVGTDGEHVYKRASVTYHAGSRSSDLSPGK